MHLVLTLLRILSKEFPWLFCCFLCFFPWILWAQWGQKILGHFEVLLDNDKNQKHQGKEGQALIFGWRKHKGN